MFEEPIVPLGSILYANWRDSKQRLFLKMDSSKTVYLRKADSREQGFTYNSSKKYPFATNMETTPRLLVTSGLFEKVIQSGC
jgi:hypothetical protein